MASSLFGDVTDVQGGSWNRSLGRAGNLCETKSVETSELEALQSKCELTTEHFGFSFSSQIVSQFSLHKRLFVLRFVRVLV